MIKRILVGGALAVAIWAVGCKQGRGDRCQVDSDCDTNLICVYPPGPPNTSIGGQCQFTLPTQTDAAADRTIDVAPPDTAVGDGATD